MAPSGRSGICCACGKKRSNHPGIRLHLFPKDARRRMQWMRALDIAFERNSQTICEDHFDAKWLGTRGKLVGNAVPRPAAGLEEQQPQTCLECPDAPSMDHAIDAASMSEMQHLSLEYDATPFGVLSFSSEDHQDLHTPVSSVRASSLAEDASFRADLGSDWDDTNSGGILQSNAPESSSLTPNCREDTLLHLDHGQGMIVKMNDFVNSVLALHPSRWQSSHQWFPKVTLERLSRETIRKYAGLQERFESLSDEMRRPSRVSPSHGRYNEDSDDSSSDSSDELPDLNDPSFCEGGKTKEGKVKKRKDKDIFQKTDTKLMKFARKAFLHQAVRYKSSKDFMKSSKATKEARNTELNSLFTDYSYSHNVQAKVTDQRLSSMTSQSTSNWDASSLVEKTIIQTTEEEKYTDGAREGSGTTPAELISLKLKENMARYVGQNKPKSVCEDATNPKMQPLDTSYVKDKSQFGEKESSNDEQLEDVLDSDDSTSTVLFDSGEMINQGIYPMESAQDRTGESGISDRNFATCTDESSNNKKRKDSPLREQSAEINKKLKLVDRQDLVRKIDKNQHPPMVMIPITISSPVTISPAAPTYSTPSSVDTPVLDAHTSLRSVRKLCKYKGSSDVPSQVNETTQLGKTVNIETVEKEMVEISCNLSSVGNDQVGENSATMVDTQKIHSNPSLGSQNGCILIESSTSQEPGNSSDENSHATTGYRAVSEEKTANNLNPVTTDQIDNDTNRIEKSTSKSQEALTNSANKEMEVEVEQKKPSSNLKEESRGFNDRPFKSLKQISLQFQELTTKRVQCEEKIKQVKEEYNSKLEALENDKKQFEVEINKMIVSMSEWKDLSEEEPLVPHEQQGAGADNPSGNVRDTVPEMTALPESSAVAPAPQASPATMAPTNNKEDTNSGRIAINVIPAASMKNFGRKKTSSQKKALVQQPELSLKQTAASSSNLEPKQHSRKVSQVPTSLASNGSREVSSANSHQTGSDQQQYSAYDKHSPPNAVVVPGQQHPVAQSRHTLPQVFLQPTTHVAQRRALVPRLVPKPAQSTNSGSSHTTYKNPGNSQTQQGQNLPHQVQQYIPVQQQQQQYSHYYQQQQQQQQPQLQQQQPQLHQQQLQQQPQLQQQQPQLQQPQLRQQQPQRRQQQPQRQQQLPQFQQQQQQPQLQQQQPQPQPQQQQQPQLQQQLQQQPQLQQQQLQQPQQQLQQQQQPQQQLQQQSKLQQQQPHLMRLLQGPQLPQLHQQQQQKQQKYQQHQQLQQQQVQLHPSSMVHPTQQLPNRSQPYLQQSQPIQAQPQIETTSQQGRVALGMHTAPVGTNNVISSSAQMTPSFTISTAMDSDKNTTTPTNRVMLTHSMQGNSFTLNTDTNIKKVKYIVSVPSIVNSVNPEAHFQHNLQSVNPASSSKVTSFSLPSGSHATTTTVNTNDTNLPTSVNMGVNQPKAGTSSAPVPYTAGGTSQECGNNELLCKMCGTAGIFTCCNNVIYCSTACQGNDWDTHQHHCTNTSSPSTS